MVSHTVARDCLSNRYADILPSTTALKRSRSLSRSAHYPVPTGGSVNSLFGSIRAGDASGVRLSKRVKQEVEHEETDIEDDEESGSESEGEGEDGTGQSEKEEPSGGASGDEFEDDYGVGSPSDSSIEGQDAVAAAGDSLGSSPEQNAGADEEKLATLDNEGGEQDGKEHVAHADDGEYGESGDLEESLVGQDAAEESRFAFEDDVSVSGSNVISSSLYSVQLSAVPHPTALPVPPKDDKDTVPITAEAERPGQHIKEIDVQSSPQENNSQEQTLTNISTPSLPSLHQFPPASPPLPHLPSPASPASQASPASPSSSPPPPPSSPPFLPALGSPHHEEASTDHEHLQQSSSQSAPQAAEEFSEPTEEEDATILQPPSSSSSSWAGSGSDGSVVDDLQLQPDVSADGTNTVSETGSANATANGTLTNPTTTTSPPPSSPITLTGPAQSMWFDLPAQQAHFSYLEDEACFLAELEEPLGGINGAVPNGVMMIPGGANETPPLTNPPPTPANPVVGLPELAHLAVEDVDWEAVANVDSFPESDDFMVEEGDFMSEDFEWEDEEELEELEAAGEDGEVEVEV
ncbi:hypothetical protein BJ508DRAFT_41907 [Ascobolus immersus RN42]|uniref:Uncharacterized protein n=1 Tax=Ascobolus immersus RN42 TaxID=1160509 RepID=A0A3N4IJ19_ASCIM|nr:hypothetical protein BJ508DRAFT_41907 [Ascobolus immersus RN42]